MSRQRAIQSLTIIAPHLDALRQRMLDYQPRAHMECLRFMPRLPDGSVHPGYARWQDGSPRQAAVLVPLALRQQGPVIVLTQRHADLAHHAGQMALPGGRIEPGETALEAALREAREEIGLPPEDINLWGQLDSLYVPPSNFMLSVFVGAVQPGSVLRPDAREVEAVVELPLRQLFDPTAILSNTDDAGMTTEYYGCDGRRVWGATARILNNLAEAAGLPCEAFHRA